MSESLKIAEQKVTYKEKKQLEKDICNLTSNEHTEILNIIRNNNQKYSENNGGVYINLKYIDENTIAKIIEFVSFCKQTKEEDDKDDGKKNNKKKKKKKKNLLGKNFTMDKNEVTAQLERLKGKKQENFSFQNYLDKLSITNIKTFKKNEKIIYPQLKMPKKKWEGVGERLLKKCRDVNRIQDNNYTDTISEEDSITDSIDSASNNIETVINKSLFGKNSIYDDISNDLEDDDDHLIDSESLTESDNLSNQ